MFMLRGVDLTYQLLGSWKTFGQIRLIPRFFIVFFEQPTTEKPPK